ncbi:SPOR domain-containing protein [Psychrobium sp. 1_MG-2023]|uniref:SPOR domain-containing protein n=1 Tax=Psychrobium sp. 1_MG-2023 TaxID=3062624 RepID=UPI000C325EEE|nr:SPOR domain-containing protein [Psychrobium sp. 1_MG-2023]MDP2561748.1 SPOR domain-containing protein [Psychrobium sp. 1_MG-2023]PKF59764.1 hypothetical protein CW748_00770 [Alteromonadales bacterium alter-6D02]
MTDQIKNRIVGAIVLFALAIIFLPDIFDGKKQSKTDAFATIPAKPIYQTPQLDKVEIDIAQGYARDNTLSSNEKNSEPAVKPEEVISQVHEKSKSAVETVVTSSIKATAPPEERKVSAVVKPETKQPTFKRSGWVITMGTFNDPGNVKRLLAKLRSKGFTAFSVPNNPIRNKPTKVFVGPELNKQSIEKVHKKLKGSFKDSGIITRFNPLEK